MAYIEKEPIIKFITKGLNNPDKTKAFGYDAIEILTEIEYSPTADVVPRAEVEKEIGEEIHRIIGDGDNETWICLLIRKLADNLTGKGEALNAETCVVCGNVIPEGRQVCPTCERRTIKK